MGGLDKFHFTCGKIFHINDDKRVKETPTIGEFIQRLN